MKFTPKKKEKIGEISKNKIRKRCGKISWGLGGRGPNIFFSIKFKLF